MVTYALSVSGKRIEGGSDVANIPNPIMREITRSPERITFRARSGPYTSVITSLIEKMKGIRKIATLAFSLIAPDEIIGNVFPPISSAAQSKKIYRATRRSILCALFMEILYQLFI